MALEEPTTKSIAEKTIDTQAEGSKNEETENDESQAQGDVSQKHEEGGNSADSNSIKKEDIDKWKIKKILLIEDDLVTQRLISTILSKKGYDVKVAENGQIALQKLKSFDPDLFIMDLNMPIMDGTELLKHLRKEKKYLLKPIIVLTSQRDKDSIVKVATYGIDSYMAKPVKLDLLDQKLAEFSRPETIIKRLVNLKKLIGRQINRIDAQKKSLKAQLRVKQEEWGEEEKQLLARIARLKNAPKNPVNTIRLKDLKSKLAKEKLAYQTWQQQMNHALQKLKDEKKRLDEDLKNVTEMLDTLNQGQAK
ncbi:MAG: response regulator [candidate division KSB1 bacterium]|nr:response regulator [candidate division KSB1 bacterium]